MDWPVNFWPAEPSSSTCRCAGPDRSAVPGSLALRIRSRASSDGTSRTEVGESPRARVDDHVQTADVREQSEDVAQVPVPEMEADGSAGVCMGPGVAEAHDLRLVVAEGAPGAQAPPASGSTRGLLGVGDVDPELSLLPPVFQRSGPGTTPPTARTRRHGRLVVSVPLHDAGEGFEASLGVPRRLLARTRGGSWPRPVADPVRPEPLRLAGRGCDRLRGVAEVGVQLGLGDLVRQGIGPRDPPPVADRPQAVGTTPSCVPSFDPPSGARPEGDVTERIGSRRAGGSWTGHSASRASPYLPHARCGATGAVAGRRRWPGAGP